eukprot:2491766-Prymnesium_polylepis.1
MVLPDDGQLLWIAQQALDEPDPVGWTERLDPLGKPYFCEDATGRILKEHPRDVAYRRMYTEHRELLLQGKYELDPSLPTPGRAAAAGDAPASARGRSQRSRRVSN